MITVQPNAIKAHFRYIISPNFKIIQFCRDCQSIHQYGLKIISKHSKYHIIISVNNFII